MNDVGCLCVCVCVLRSDECVPICEFCCRRNCAAIEYRFRRLCYYPRLLKSKIDAVRRAGATGARADVWRRHAAHRRAAVRYPTPCRSSNRMHIGCGFAAHYGVIDCGRNGSGGAARRLGVSGRRGGGTSHSSPSPLTTSLWCFDETTLMCIGNDDIRISPPYVQAEAEEVRRPPRRDANCHPLAPLSTVRRRILFVWFVCSCICCRCLIYVLI